MTQITCHDISGLSVRNISRGCGEEVECANPGDGSRQAGLRQSSPSIWAHVLAPAQTGLMGLAVRTA